MGYISQLALQMRFLFKLLSAAVLLIAFGAGLTYTFAGVTAVAAVREVCPGDRCSETISLMWFSVAVVAISALLGVMAARYLRR